MRFALICFLLLPFILSRPATGQKVNWEEPPIEYSKRYPSQNRVAKLQQEISTGQFHLRETDELGKLKQILTELDIPISSQVMTFAKTSLQKQFISPKTPRAIYFNDSVHLGYVQGGLIEIAAADPEVGAAFYTWDLTDGQTPALMGQTNRCLNCHGSSRTQGVPGFLIRSVFANDKGKVIVRAGSKLTSHRSPLMERWGGWYVMGTHGNQSHLGNYILPGKRRPKEIINSKGANKTALPNRVDPTFYLSNHSDIVALMVLEHQATAWNLLTEANFVAQHAQMILQQDLATGVQVEIAKRKATTRIRSAALPLLRYLFFVDEEAITAPIAGTSDFIHEFQEQRQHQWEEHSLRDFDLKTRLFQFRCSYLIYTEVFSKLPTILQSCLQDEILMALNDLTSPLTAKFSIQERESIKSILANSPPDWFNIGSPFSSGR